MRKLIILPRTGDEAIPTSVGWRWVELVLEIPVPVPLSTFRLAAELNYPIDA